MKPIASVGRTKEIIQKHNFRFSKGLGQNFLIDSNYIRKIVEAAELTKGEVAWEIGPGIGTLTEALAEAAGWVVALELDDRLIPILAETMEGRDNVAIIHGDALKINWLDVARENVPASLQTAAQKVVANLPYYVTTPIITGLLKGEFPWERLVVMVQKEVAERIIASPGGKDYGALSVYCQYYTQPHIAAIVPPAVFMPPPSVASAVVVMRRRERPPVNLVREETFFRVVKGAFAQRRKTLVNSIFGSGGLNLPKEVFEKAVETAGIDPKRRGESLSLDEFARLANLLDEKIKV